MSGKRWQNGDSQHETNRFCWREKKIITRRENKEINQRERKNETKRKDPTKRNSKKTNEKTRKWWKTKQQNKRWKTPTTFSKKKRGDILQKSKDPKKEEIQGLNTKEM